MAYLDYARDKNVAFGKHYGLANFLKNQIYLKYINLELIIGFDDRTLRGVYKKDESKFICSDNEFYTLTENRFLELLQEGRIKFANKEDAA